MTKKEKILQALQKLPDNVSIEGAMEQIMFLSRIERGIEAADASWTVPHSQVKERMANWVK